MKLIDFETVVDEVFGEVGAPTRDAMEKEVANEVNAYFVGEAIKRIRLQNRLSQAELGQKIGVKRAQICKIESGKCSPNLATIKNVLQALGVNTATLDLGKAGQIKLW